MLAKGGKENTCYPDWLTPDEWAQHAPGSSVQTAIPAEAPVALQTQHNFRVRGNDISYISKHHLNNFFCAFRFASFASIIVRNRMMVLLESPFFFTLSEISPTCQNQGTGFELTLQEDPSNFLEIS